MTELRQTETEQAALRRVATLVAEGSAPEAVFGAVADEVAALLECDTSAIARFEADGSATLLGGHRARRRLGERFPLHPEYVLAAVRNTGQPARFDTDDPAAATMPEPVRAEGIRSGLAAPIVVDGDLWGAITVASLHRPFLSDTARRLTDFTDLIATAIANAESREAVARLAEEQAALRRVATLVAEGAPSSALGAVVVEELVQALGAPSAWLARYEPGRIISIAAAVNDAGFPVGSSWPLEGESVAGRVYETGRPARIDDYSALQGEIAAQTRESGLTSAAAAPVTVDGTVWGVFCVATTGPEPLPADTLDRLVGFGDLVATAISNAEARDDLRLLAEEQAALRRVATLVAHGVPPEDVFGAVSEEVGRLFEADLTVMGRYEKDSAVALGSWSSSSDNLIPKGTRSEIGGRNVLSEVAETGEPARLDAYDDATGEAAEIARRFGWRASIAAPIVDEGRVWGVMLVATTRDQPFPADAEHRLAAFTDLIATAIGNAEAHDEVRRFGDEQAALGRVATLVAGGAAPEQVFAAVVDEVSSLLGLERIELVRYQGDNTGIVIAASGDHPFPAGSAWSLDDPSVMATVARTRRAARIDDYTSLDGEIARTARGAGFQSAIGAPITVEGRLWGVIIAISTDPEPIPEGSELRLGHFTDLIATAVANAESRSALAASRRRIVAASDETRRQIERDLHDGTQQRLVTLGLAVRAAEASLPPERDDLRAQLSGVAAGLVSAVEDLQEISRGIHPAILSKGGLAAALQSLAHRSAIPVDLDVTADVRLAEPIEVAAYFVVSEALANAAKHSAASRIDVSLAQHDGRLVLSVRDDGVGGADAAQGSGLVGLTDRVEALGGSIRLASRAGEGTRITVELPLELKPSPIAGTRFESAEASRPSLLGRDDELRRLYALIGGIAERGGALIVRGEAGIGKSTLLASVSKQARRQGVTVVTTTGADSEAHLAFAGLHQLLLPFLDRLERLPDPQRRALEAAFGPGAGKAPDIFLIALATLGLVTDAAAEAPLLLVVEDAQWLDRASAEVLAFVGRRLEIEPVILLFAVRDGVPSAIDSSGLADLSLAGLDADAAIALLEFHAEGLSDELKARILVEAAGNPLALIELPAAVDKLGGESVGSEPLPLTTRLEQAFASKLPDLESEPRALLLLAALDDGELPELNRAAAVLLGGTVSLDAWTQAADAGLGTLTAARFRFRHPLVRSAVEQAATAEECRRGHAALAESLAANPDRAVWHSAAAAAGPDEEVALALDSAADRARLRGGRDIELAALERAADLTPDPGVRALRLHRAGLLAYDLGRSNDSVRLLTQATNLGLPSHERAAARFTLEALAGTWSGAQTVRGCALAARELAESGDDRRALLMLETVALRAHWSNLDQETRRHATDVVDGLDVPADDPMRLSVLGLFDPIERGREVADWARQLSPRNFEDPLELVSVGMGASAVWADSVALPLLRAAVAGLRADGRLAQLARALVLEAWSELRRGNVRGAITAAAEGVRLAEETGEVRYVLIGKVAHGIAAAERGEGELVEELFGEAETALHRMGANPLLATVAFARGRHALVTERFADAYESLARIFDPADAAHHPFAGGWALADLAEAGVRSDGDLDLVRRLMTEWRGITATTRATELEVQLTYARAILASGAAAEGRFQAVLTAASQTWPYFEARTQLAYGEWLQRQRRAEESRGPLREAVQTFEALGQVVLAGRARRELGASGDHARPRAPEAWAQLTPQELQIAQLAADGLSNREIGERLYLSHRTVGSHLFRLFPKLGVTSRTQLREALEPPSEPAG